MINEAAEDLAWGGGGIGPYKSYAIIKDQYFRRGNGGLLVAQMCIPSGRGMREKEIYSIRNGGREKT